MSTYNSPRGANPRGMGRAILAGVLLLVAGTLNVIYGIAAIDDANVFVANAHFVASNLNTWGWVVLCLGGLQLLAALSIWKGGLYGLFFGIVMGGLGALAALLTIDAYPGWSIALFALDIFIIWGLVQYTADVRGDAL